MAESPRLLLVEDDPELGEFMRFLFEQEKYEVVTATDGEAALEKAHAARPDIIVLDVLLPKVHGYEVCDRLRQDPTTCLIPIIMVTSLTAIKDRVTGIKLGADEYVSKPFEPVELLARVERLVQRARQNLAANPLTGLAGSAAFEAEMKARLTAGDAFTVALADINALASYNNTYGFEKGDGVIRLVGTILRSAVSELGNRSDLVAHLGADEFAFVSTPSRSEVIGVKVLENMESLIPLHYDEAVRRKGSYPAKDGAGGAADRPLLSLALGLVDVVPNLYQHHAQILDRARQALGSAKKKNGNQLLKVS